MASHKINLRGHVFTDAGNPVEGATVQLIESGGTTVHDTFTVGGTAGTTSDGEWYFNEDDQNEYDIKISSSSGNTIRYIRWDDQISVKEIDVRNNTGNTIPAATFTNHTNNVSNQVAVFSGANTTRADGDEIYLSFKLANDNAELTEFARITAEANDVSNGSEDGEIRFDVMKGGNLTTVWTLDSLVSGAMEFDMNVDTLRIGSGADTDVSLTFDANSANGVITWMEDEDYFRFSDDILLLTTEKLQLRDTAIYLYSSADGQADLVADTTIQVTAPTVNIEASTAITLESDSITFGEAGDTDIVLNFNANTADGVITWMEDEDYFKFSDEIFMNSTEKILFGDSGTFIHQSSDGVLTIESDTTVDINGAVAFNGALSGIVSIYAQDLIIGEDSETAIDFGTANEIDFKINNTTELTLDASALYPTGDAGLDLGTASLEFKDAFFDGTVTSDAFAGPLTGNVTGDVTGTSSKVTVTDSTSNTNFPVVFHDENDALLDDTGALRYNPSTGQLLVPNLTVAGTTTQVNTVTMNAQNAVVFEGATADAYETTLSIVDPTSDHTQYLVNQGGYIPVLAAATTTAISATPAEINLIDGGTARGTDALASGDGILINDAGTMKMTNVDTVGTYLAGLHAGTVTSTGLSDSSGVITLDIQNMTASTTIADADLVVIDDGADGTLRKMTRANFIESAALDAINIDGGAIDAVTLGTNSAITQAVIDDIDINGKVITMTGSSSDTAVFTAGTNGTLSIVTTDAAAAAANIQITADGTAELAGTTVTLDSAGDITLDAGGADLIFADDGTNLLKITNSSSDVVFQPQVDAKDIKFNQYDGRTLLDINDGGYVGLHNGATGPGEIRIYEDTDLGSHYTGFKAGNATASVSYVLPTADGSADEVLSTDGSGTLSWAAASSGAVSAVANGSDNRVATFSSSTALNGEANLTFDGTTLLVSNTAPAIRQVDTNYTSYYVESKFDDGHYQWESSNNNVAYRFKDSTGTMAQIAGYGNDPTYFAVLGDYDATGKFFGIGTDDPAHVLHVSGSDSGEWLASFDHSSGDAYGLRIRHTGDASDDNVNMFLQCGDSSTVRLKVWSDGDVQNHDGTFSTLSDSRIKQNVVNANSQWDDIKALVFKNFKKKDDVTQYGEGSAPVHMGLIAQEVETTSPNLVKEYAADAETDGLMHDDFKVAGATVKGIKYSILFMKATKALQEAMARIETLETKVTALES